MSSSIKPKSISQDTTKNASNTKRVLKTTDNKSVKKPKVQDSKEQKAKKSNVYSLLDWDNALELFTNGDYAKSQDTTKTTYKVKDFWNKVAKLLKRNNGESVKKSIWKRAREMGKGI